LLTFVRIGDSTQNLPARVRTVQIIVLVLLSICVVRLWRTSILSMPRSDRSTILLLRFRCLEQ